MLHPSSSAAYRYVLLAFYASIGVSAEFRNGHFSVSWTVYVINRMWTKDDSEISDSEYTWKQFSQKPPEPQTSYVSFEDMCHDLETERLINFVMKLNSPRAAGYSEIVTYFSRLNESIIRYFCVFLRYKNLKILQFCWYRFTDVRKFFKWYAE